MENLFKIHEGCEKLCATFKFLVEVFGSNFDKLLWPWPLNFWPKSDLYLMIIALGVRMEILVKIHEGCEKLLATFKFLGKFFGWRFDNLLWPWPLTFWPKSDLYLWRIALGLSMEGLVKIHEVCEKLLATFKFLGKVFGSRFDKVMWPWPLTFWHESELYIWSIALGVSMETLVKIDEECEKSLATFNFLGKVCGWTHFLVIGLTSYCDLDLWPFDPKVTYTYGVLPWESVWKVWLKLMKAVKSY